MVTVSKSVYSISREGEVLVRKIRGTPKTWGSTYYPDRFPQSAQTTHPDHIHQPVHMTHPDYIPKPNEMTHPDHIPQPAQMTHAEHQNTAKNQDWQVS